MKNASYEELLTKVRNLSKYEVKEMIFHYQNSIYEKAKQMNISDDEKKEILLLLHDMGWMTMLLANAYTK